MDFKSAKDLKKTLGNEIKLEKKSENTVKTKQKTTTKNDPDARTFLDKTLKLLRMK